MKTIHKLVLKSYLGPMILTFLIVMFVLMMNVVWRYIDELVGKGLSTGIIIELMVYLMTNMIPLGLPLATLLAAIMTLGNLGENYELLAMKSAGMSLIKITKPLIIVIGIVAVGSFFIGNNLVPYANKKAYSILFDIRQQKPTIEFQDGLFFNGIENMSIRVDKQDPATKLLRGVLIYDNTPKNGIGLGNMSTLVADSGYIHLSDDKKFLNVIMYNGERYDQTRNSQWYSKSNLKHYKFDLYETSVPMEGFAMQRSDANAFSNSQTKTINQLQYDIDSLDVKVSSSTSQSYEPFLKDYIFSKDNTVLIRPDSLIIDRSDFKHISAIDSIAPLNVRNKERIWDRAYSSAKTSLNMFNYDETTTKEALYQLYKSKIEWHKKLSLPVSIMIFFLIGAPLGAIIRKGGLGTPIVISIAFFVIYYIISITGEKMAKEGTWDAILGVWISSIILSPLAIYLTYKATNDSGLFDMEWYRNKFKGITDWLTDKFRIIKQNRIKPITDDTK